MKRTYLLFILLFVFIFQILNSQETKNNISVNWQIVGDETFPSYNNSWHQAKGINGIGQVRSIYVDPKDNNHLIIGTMSGGIWETFSALKSNKEKIKWNCLTNNIPAFVTNRVLEKNGKIYAASSSVTSGKHISSMFKRYGLGVIKKSINSDNWEIPNFNFDCRYFDIIENNGNIIIYAISDRNIYKSIDDGKNWKELASFNKLLTNKSTLLQRILIKPDDPDVVFIFTRNSKELLYKTTDGGLTWQNISSVFENLIDFKLTTNQISTKPFYYKTENKLYIALHSNQLAYIINSTDWENFELYNKSNKGIYVSSMRRTVFLKHDGIILYGGTELYKLLDGKSSKRLSLNKIHADIRDLKLFDRDSKEEPILYIATDGGIVISKDMGETYTNISGNLNLFQTFNMAYNNYNNHRIITIGTQDDGWYRIDRDGDNKWDLIETCCEGGVYTQPDDPNVTYIVNKGKLMRSDVGVAHPVIFKYLSNIIDFDAPIAFHPDFPETIVFSTPNRLKISYNKGETSKTIIVENPKTKIRPTAMSFCKDFPSNFYFSSFTYYANKNHIYKTSNMDAAPGDIIFTDITDNLRSCDSDVLDKDIINDIEVHNENPNMIWVCFGNVNDGKKIYYSKDGGIKWTNISYNLANVPVNRIKYDTTNKLLFIGTDYGVYYLRNKLWTRYGDELPIAIITAIEIDAISNELIVSTHGRGVWSASTNILPFKDIIITKDTTWTTDRIINGDLIIKNNAVLTINDAKLSVSNIIVEKNSSLIWKKGNLVSKSTTYVRNNNYLNTTLQLEEGSLSKFENVTIQNFNINLSANVSLYSNNVNLKNSKVNLNGVLDIPLRLILPLVLF